MLQTRALSFEYTPQKSFQFPDIQCSPKETLLILGQSGCGKTTLLHILAGLLRPKSGTVELAGTNLATLSGTALDAFRGKQIGVVFQQSHLIKALNVQENLQLAAYLSNQRQDAAKVQKMLASLNLSDKLYSAANQLSLGEQQRVAIARALINEPVLILADEPTSSLDDKNCEEVFNLLQAQAEAYNAGLVIVTHDIRLKEKVANQVILQ